MVLGAGLLISVATAIVPLLLGGRCSRAGSHTFDLPVLGTVKVTSALFFDIGVYLAVIGLAMMVFESFGDDPPAGRASELERDGRTGAGVGRVSVLMAFTAAALFGDRHLPRCCSASCRGSSSASA